MKAIILKYDEERHDYIVEDLDDDRHLVIKESQLQNLKERLGKVNMRGNTICWLLADHECRIWTTSSCSRTSRNRNKPILRHCALPFVKRASNFLRLTLDSQRCASEARVWSISRIWFALCTLYRVMQSSGLCYSTQTLPELVAIISVKGVFIT